MAEFYICVIVIYMLRAVCVPLYIIKSGGVLLQAVMLDSLLFSSTARTTLLKKQPRTYSHTL